MADTGIKIVAGYFIIVLILIVIYLGWTSNFGDPSCTNGIIPCKLPGAEQQFVTNPGITDQQFAQEVLVGGLLFITFVPMGLAALIWIIKAWTDRL